MGGPETVTLDGTKTWAEVGGPLGLPPGVDPSARSFKLDSPERIAWFKKYLTSQKSEERAKWDADLKNKLKPDAITEQILARKKKQEELLLPGAMAATMATGARGLPRSVGTMPSPLPDLLGRK